MAHASDDGGSCAAVDPRTGRKCPQTHPAGTGAAGRPARDSAGSPCSCSTAPTSTRSPRSSPSPARRERPLRGVRPSLPGAARPRGDLRRAREPRRDAVVPGLRRGRRDRPRPDREEAAVPRGPGLARLLDRDRRLPVPLRLLPELGDRPGTAPRAGHPAAARCRPSRSSRRRGRAGAGSIAYTYVEPTVFLEYALDTGRLAREAGLRNLFITDGYATPEAVDLLAGGARRRERRPQELRRRLLPAAVRRAPGPRPRGDRRLRAPASGSR